LFLVLNATFLALLVDIVWEKARGKEERGKEKRKGREGKWGLAQRYARESQVMKKANTRSF